MLRAQAVRRLWARARPRRLGLWKEAALTQVVYDKEGRGVLRLSCLSEPAVDAGVQRARQLVEAEAVVQRHGALCWQRAAGTTFTRCARCGHTAVLTWCGERLFVDSCSPLAPPFRGPLHVHSSPTEADHLFGFSATTG